MNMNYYNLITAKELQIKEFPPINWIVDDILPEGLTILAGKPKLGKSWAALDLGCAVSEGSQFLGNICEKGDVIYLALEDNERRLKERLQLIRPEGVWADNFHLKTEWPILDEKGLNNLENLINQYENTRLIIIDTLARVKPLSNKGVDYADDYSIMAEIQSLASRHRIAILLIHHVRKAKSDSGEPFDEVAGSTALTGAADATLVLTKNSDGAILYGRGRDLKEFTHAVEFDGERCRWKLLGDPDTVFLSDTRRLILNALEDGKATIKNISIHANISYDNCKKTLKRMYDAGQVVKINHQPLRYGLKLDPLEKT